MPSVLTVVWRSERSSSAIFCRRYLLGRPVPPSGLWPRSGRLKSSRSTQNVSVAFVPSRARNSMAYRHVQANAPCFHYDRSGANGRPLHTTDRFHTAIVASRYNRTFVIVRVCRTDGRSFVSGRAIISEFRLDEKKKSSKRRDRADYWLSDPLSRPEQCLLHAFDQKSASFDR